MLVPPQRYAADGPERRTVLVSGPSSEVGAAVRDADRDGWDTWAVVRTAGADWRMTVVRRPP